MMIKRLYIKSFLLLLSAAPIWFACSQEDKQSRFTLLSSKHTNINFSNDLKDQAKHNILRYANFYGGAGVGVGDFNNDGLQDLYFAGNQVSDKLYLNLGDLKFKDITQEAGILDDGGWSTGVTIADVNNDGLDDIYISRELYDDRPEWRTNLLYINNGNNTFKESAQEYGVANSDRTRHATFLDYNKDGFLDLFLLIQPPNPGSLSDFKGADLSKPEYGLKFYKGDGTKFHDVTKEAGLDHVGFPNGVSASDLNDDGWTDLYVANDFYAPDFLFINNQDGTFTNKIDNALNHISYYSMGVDVADINNDGLLDISVLDMVAEDNFRLKSNMSGMDRNSFWEVLNNGGHYQYMYNTLQLNNGNTTFSDIAQLTGTAATDWSWSNLIADFDNDGFKDIYITNGLLRDIRNTDADKKVAEIINNSRLEWIKKHPDGGNIKSVFDIIDLKKALAPLPSQPLKNYVFRNKKNLDFEKVMDEWGMNEESFSNGAAYADLDNDGDLDLVVNNINAEAFLYRNNSDKKSNSNYFRLRLENGQNRPVFGARATIFSKNEKQTIETTNVRGIYSTSESYVHFGIGNATEIDSLYVIWPNGETSFKKNIEANSTMSLNMKDEVLSGMRTNEPHKKLFTNAESIFPISHQHIENSFDDYDKQVLLPHKMSQFGPAMTVADINGDGLEDIYIGGATGHSASLYQQTETGDFITTNEELWLREAPYEDVDAVFVDVNSDGFKDLFVLSGGNEFPANDFHYSDRIYFNDGQGNFNKGALLNAYRTSGSRVLAADYDNDGDTDLFIGGRHVPHQYPKPATSYLLKNNNGQLVNVTEELAPELLNIGMVTDAEWSDHDKDGDLDLILVGEWMIITILDNDNGRLVKKEIPSLSNTSGWWFSIAKGDFDNDGDDDFIAGNLGLNYKYKTSENEPFDVYYNDFDGNGSNDIVLGYYNDNKHFPLRGFSCSAEQVPGLKQKIKKYDVFASLELESVYDTKSLENSLHYETNTFASSYIENLGDGNFKVSELPRFAQLTNINDMLVDDYNGDGWLDVLSVGNLFVSEVETPRNDAGTGLLLLGNGKGSFKPQTSRHSGFFVNGDAKKLVPFTRNDSKMVLVAQNNDALKSFSINQNP
ncbi:VCBS repeat-containing protein [Flagellimonas sp. 2504JD1-5]